MQIFRIKKIHHVNDPVKIILIYKTYSVKVTINRKDSIQNPYMENNKVPSSNAPFLKNIFKPDNPTM